MARSVEVLPNRFQETLDFATKVADIIGGTVTPERVANLITTSNDQGFLFHGIKRADKFREIDQKGILPLTPEGGFVSFWTQGKSIFGDLKTNGSLDTFDATFFNYAHGRRHQNGPREMNIAVTKRDLAFPQDINRPDGQKVAHHTIPRDLIVLLQTRQNLGLEKETVEPVRSNQVEMFELLEEVVKNFTPGSTLRRLY